MNEIIPLLLFMNDNSYPPSIPSSIQTKLLYYFGRDIQSVQKACESFNNCFSLLTDIFGQLAVCDSNATSDLNLQLQRRQKTTSSGFLSIGRNVSKTNQQSIVYLYSCLFNLIVEMLINQLSSCLFVSVPRL